MLSTVHYANKPLLEEFLDKRAQGRSLLGRINWRRRYFVLQRHKVSYWDRPIGPQAKCKGLIDLERITAVEVVADETFGRPNMLQIVHSSVLYIQCPNEASRQLWLASLRPLVAHNSFMHSKYHPGFFEHNKRWSCCHVPSFDVKGCQSAFDYR